MGFGCSYHPYECSHDKFCEHCTNAVTAWHEPSKCWLCCDGDPAENQPEKFVDEQFAVKIRVQDYSHRKLRVSIYRGQVRAKITLMGKQAQAPNRLETR